MIHVTYPTLSMVQVTCGAADTVSGKDAMYRLMPRNTIRMSYCLCLSTSQTSPAYFAESLQLVRDVDARGHLIT